MARNGFRDRPIRPLSHLSTEVAEPAAGRLFRAAGETTVEAEAYRARQTFAIGMHA